MGIPDYIISHTIGEELKYRRAQDRFGDDVPAPQLSRNADCERLATVRCRLGAQLRALADRIERPWAIGSR